MAIRMGGKTQAHTVCSAYIGVRGDPVWSAEQVSYTTTQYMTRDSAKLYDAWDRWPIDEKGALAPPAFTGTAWALFGSFDGLVYWKAQTVDHYLNEFKSAKLDEETGLAEVTSHPHPLSCRIPGIARRIRKGYIGQGGVARLFYEDPREGDEV
ncbi:MAG: hypothetical protein IJO51_09915 [Clostridia bacterium]|nr:hypothetical protein [Clostridia bacterium]